MDQRTLSYAIQFLRGTRCEGLEFKPHVCQGPFQINEVLIPKNIFQKLPKELHDYFYHPINCSLNCQTFHASHGHSRKFREWFKERVERIYGEEIVRDWIEQAPLKIRRIK